MFSCLFPYANATINLFISSNLNYLPPQSAKDPRSIITTLLWSLCEPRIFVLFLAASGERLYNEKVLQMLVDQQLLLHNLMITVLCTLLFIHTSNGKKATLVLLQSGSTETLIISENEVAKWI